MRNRDMQVYDLGFQQRLRDDRDEKIIENIFDNGNELKREKEFC